MQPRLSNGLPHSALIIDPATDATTSAGCESRQVFGDRLVPEAQGSEAGRRLEQSVSSSIESVVVVVLAPVPAMALPLLLPVLTPRTTKTKTTTWTTKTKENLPIENRKT